LVYVGLSHENVAGKFKKAIAVPLEHNIHHISAAELLVM
jgi:hypothetical protein